MRSIVKVVGMLATGNVRGVISLVLGLALLGGLWETSLYNLSSRATATAIMTEVGVELINPVLVHNSLGLSDTFYASLQQEAKTAGAQALAIPGLKVHVTGNEIAGKSFADGTQLIYGKVAAAFYDGGPSAVFSVPDQLTQALSTLSLLPQAVVNQGAKQVGVPQLPQVPLPPLAAVGLSLQTLTAQGHAQVLTLDKWFLGIAFLCALLLAVLSSRWKRLSNPAWALVSGAVPGAFGIGVVAFFAARYSTPFKPYAGLLHLLAGAFMPVYLGALAVGVLALVVAGVGDVVLGMVAGRQPAEARTRARQSQEPGFYEQPVGVYRRPAPQQPAAYTPSYSDRGSGARSPYPSAADPTQAYAARDYGGTAPPPWASTAWQQSGRESGWPPATEGGQRQASPSGPQWSRGPNSAPRPPTTWQLDPGAAPWSPPGAMTQRPPATSGPLQPPDPDGHGPLWPPAPAWGGLSQPQARQPAGPPARQPGSSGPNWPPAPPYGQSAPSGQPWPPRPNNEPRPPQADDEPWASQADDDPWAPRRP